MSGAELYPSRISCHACAQVWHYQSEMRQMETHYIGQLEKLSAEKDTLDAEVKDLRARLGIQGPPSGPPVASAPVRQTRSRQR